MTSLGQLWVSGSRFVARNAWACVSLVCIVLVCGFTSCQDKVVNINQDLTLDVYADLASDSLALKSRRIRMQIRQMYRNDNDSMSIDRRIKNYYDRGGALVWIDRHGVDPQADTLLACLDSIEGMGMTKKKFRVEEIREDLRRMRELDFDTANTINRVAGRLEYNLTKGYLRYAVGQRFGFMNPSWVYNKLDTLQKSPHDSTPQTNVHYRGLFDLPVERAYKDYYKVALQKVAHDSVGAYLRELDIKSPLYYKLKRRYAECTSESERIKILCNMERCRWRMSDYPQRHKKYVVVNVPSLMLHAVDGDNVLSMLVACGSNKTKTPLLVSEVERMDVNPKWIMPRSIIERSVVNHVGDVGWFERNNYFVKDKKTNKVVPTSSVTKAMLLSGNYAVMQESGENNSLGRIIFRFENNFSVFLHSTSSPGQSFSRADREVSHGCVRVEKPYALAEFMLEDKDPDLLEKIRYSMSADLSPLHKAKKKKDNPKNDADTDDSGDDGEEEPADTLQRDKLVYAIPLKPKVPLFIVYFTIYPDPSTGRLADYRDVYNYDKVIWDYLKNYR